MSSKNSNSQHLFFVDPSGDLTYSYDQFELDLRVPRENANTNSPYAVICQLVANLLRQDNFSFENGMISPNSGTVDSKLTSQQDWCSSMLESTSKIQLTTSGTTGTPKAVSHSIKTLTRGVRTGQDHQHDVWALAYPIGHLSGVQVLFQALCNRNTIVQLFGLSAEAAHLAIERYGITHISCTPTFLKLLSSGVHSHAAVKRLTTGGECCETSTAQAVCRLFPNAKHRNIYALTEVGNLLIGNGEEFSVPSELQNLIKIEEGSLAIHPSLLVGSVEPQSSVQEYGNAKPKNEASTNDIYDWFMTGDLVEVITESPLSFRFVARENDIINVGGYKVVPQQVESELLKSPAVQQVVVFGKKNSVTGQIVACRVVVEPEEDFDQVAIRKQLSEVLPRYAVPRIFTVVDFLPMMSTGKLSRRDLE